MMKSTMIVMILLGLVAMISGSPVATRTADSLFSPVVLQNQTSFSARQMLNVTLNNLLNDFLTTECGNLGPVCIALEPYFQEILPSLTVIESLNAQGTAGTDGTDGAGDANLDLLLQLFTFPPPNSLVNEALLEAFGVEILPSSAITYFAAQAWYNTSFSAASVTFEAQDFTIFQSYSQIIEFNDTNQNNLYDLGEAVQFYYLGRQNWEPTTFGTVFLETSTVFQVGATTSDGVVNFICQTASSPVIDGDGQILTPNATKCSITINNFPFQGTTSNLAIVANTALIGAYFGVSAVDAINVANPPAGTIGGGFSWVTSVTVGSNSFSVAAVASTGAPNVDLATKFVLYSCGSVTVDIRNITFTFQTGTNPSQIFWDPTVTYGNAPVQASPTSATTPSASATTSSASALSFSLFAILLSLLSLLI